MNLSKELLKSTGAAAAGAAAGTSAGLAGSAAAISSAGAVGGLSGAGITSGLAAIGGSVLGGAAILTCGVAVLAVGGAFAGYRLASRRRLRGRDAGAEDGTR